MKEYSIGNKKVFQIYEIEGHSLAFVEIPDSEKVALASDDELVQDWIGALHRKSVKPADIHYVVAAARRAFKEADPVASATFARKKKESAEPVDRLNKYCQYEWKESMTIEYDMDLSIPHSPSVYARIKLPNGSYYDGEGSSQREARIAAAKDALEKLQSLITDADCEADDSDDYEI